MQWIITAGGKACQEGKNVQANWPCYNWLLVWELQKTYSFKSYCQLFWRASGTQAKKSATLGRMGCVCWLVSLKWLGFWFQIIDFFLGPPMHKIDDQKANLLEHFPLLAVLPASHVMLHEYLKGKNQHFVKSFLHSADSFRSAPFENFLKNVDFSLQR